METNQNQDIDRNKTKKMSNVQKQDKKNPKIEEERKNQVNYANQEIAEDITMYGEFISTYFAWIPPAKQKERAEELEKMTKNKSKQ